MSRTPQVRLTILNGPVALRDRNGWGHYAYTVRLRYQGRHMQSPWKQGVGVTSDPEPHDLIGSMLSDTQTIENTTGYHDWAGEYGYDSDLNEHRDTYEACKVQAERLERLLGRPLMVALMDDEDATYGSAERFAAAWKRAQAKVAAR